MLRLKAWKKVFHVITRFQLHVPTQARGLFTDMLHNTLGGAPLPLPSRHLFLILATHVCLWLKEQCLSALKSVNMPVGLYHWGLLTRTSGVHKGRNRRITPPPNLTIRHHHIAWSCSNMTIMLLYMWPGKHLSLSYQDQCSVLIIIMPAASW